MASFAVFFFLMACVFMIVIDKASALAGSKSKRNGISGQGFGSGQKTSFTHTADIGEQSKGLVKFLNSQGAKGLKNVDIGFDNDTGRRGLFCTKKLKKNEKFCQIPSDCALALADPSKNGADAPTPAHRGANLLEMYMKNDKASQLWSPYFDMLPKLDSKAFDRTPDFFTEEDLELLEFPRVINRAKQRRKQIEEMAAERHLSFEELQFATWLTTSRQFKLYIPTPDNDKDSVMPEQDEKGQIISKGGEKQALYVLVPFIDIANHSSDQPNCKLTLIDPEKDEAWFALEATRPIAAGKELVIAYGNGLESSTELFQNYGFVPSANKIDALMIQKGGDDTIAELESWTTTLEEDLTMLNMAEDDPVLQKILRFRIRLKESY
mmetsp:Transcript_26778/g.62915  ORF Transcript_26778/g.62915 Transcript_26778/m.62915 type:complete len:380 (+) Transcript_26778:65-1204(+)